MIRDIGKYIWGSLSKRIARSLLTAFSIVIGIMAIYALVSFGEGLNKYVQDFAEEAGTDKMILQPIAAGPPGSAAGEITDDDIDIIERHSDVRLVAPSYLSNIEVKNDPNKLGKWVYVMGLPPDEEKMRLLFFSYDLDKGRWLKKGDKNKVMLGYNHQIDNKIWERGLEVGSKIYINEVKFDVIGFVESLGNPGDDANVYIPNDNNADVFEVEDVYNMVIIQAKPGINTSDLADELTDDLRKEKDQKEGQEDFYISSFAEQIEIFTNILDTLNIVLSGIAFISIIVAAVNIANTMYTAVLERTKEIGLMKAIGARNSYIMSIFFVESAVLGFMGGLIGIGFGYVIAKIGGAIAVSAGYDLLQPYFPLWLTAGCLIGATLVGTLSGFFPARSAARQKPVDALRYE